MGTMTMLAFALHQLDLVHDHTEALLEMSNMNEEVEPTYRAHWTSGGGTLAHDVSTYQEAGETIKDAATRHKAAVDALLALFPADPGSMKN